ALQEQAYGRVGIDAAGASGGDGGGARVVDGLLEVPGLRGLVGSGFPIVLDGVGYPRKLRDDGLQLDSPSDRSGAHLEAGGRLPRRIGGQKGQFSSSSVPVPRTFEHAQSTGIRPQGNALDGGENPPAQF